MTDTHAHINSSRFAGDLPAVVERALAANVDAIVVVGVDLPSSRLAIEIAARYANCWATVGVHPHEAEACDAATWQALADLARAPRVVAIGETGLDYYRNLASKPAQQRALANQLGLAAELRLPVVVHMREAFTDVHRMLAQAQPSHPVIMHCFSGDTTQATAFLKLDCMLSLAGPVTFRSARKLHEVAKMVPSDRLLLETDCPYLAPTPFRGKRNEPAYVRHTLEAVAKRRGVTPEYLEEITDSNAQAAFGFSVAGTSP